MGGGQEADGTFTRSDAEAPTPPRRAPLAKPGVLVGMAAALGVVLGVVGVVVLTTGPDALRADGKVVANGRQALRAAESIAAGYVDVENSDEVATSGDIRCWFAYQDGAESPENLLCGPLRFADSEPGTHWLATPVGFERQRDSDRVRAEPGIPESRRTVARPDDVELRRPDGRSAPDNDDVDIERPDAAAQAEPATVGEAWPGEVMVDLDEPEDGRLNGVGYSWQITGTATADPVSLASGTDEPGTITAAADGEEWLLVGVETELSSAVLADTTLDAAVVVDGEQRIPIPEPVGSTSVVAVSVPDDAEDVVLEIDDGHLAQTWSVGDGTRSGGADVLYRDEDERVVTLDQSFALPFGARDLHPIPGLEPLDLGEYGYIPGIPGTDHSRPFGEVSLNLTVGAAHLDYAMEARTPGGIVNTTFHSAGAPDRALLFLTDVSAEWSDAGISTEYMVPPENAVLTLPDGTQIAATRPGGEPEFGGFLDLGLDGSGLGSGSGLAWNVPADLQTATLTLSFPTRSDILYELDFQNATVKIELDFS